MIPFCAVSINEHSSVAYLCDIILVMPCCSCFLPPGGSGLSGSRADAGLVQRVDQPQKRPDTHEGAGPLQAHAAAPVPARARPALLQAPRGARRGGRQDALLQLQALSQGGRGRGRPLLGLVWRRPSSLLALCVSVCACVCVRPCVF